MKHKITIILIALIIFNLIIGSILILDIQAFTTPITKVEINIIDINSEELTLQTIVNIENTNNFDISIKNFEVISNTEDDKEIGRILINGGEIKANNNKTFTSQDNFILKNENITVLKNFVNAKVSLNLFGLIKKTIPINITVLTSIENVINQIKQPNIKINSKLTEITENGLNFTTKIEVNNPTHFSYKVEEILIEIEKEDKTNVGEITIVGDIIEPKKTIILTSNGTITFNALDAEILWFKLTGIAGVKIAGIYKNVNIKANASLIIPDIKEFIFGNDPIEFKIPVQFKLKLKGISANIGFEMFNPSNFSLTGENLLCSFLRFDDNTSIILGTKKMEKCIISPHDKTCLKTNITIPYVKYLKLSKGRLRPNWFVIKIEGDFHIAGTQQAVPISLNAYIDPHIFVNRNFNN